MGFEGRVSISLPGFDPIESASGVGLADLGVQGLQLTRLDVVHADDISGMTSIPVTDPGAAPVTSILFTASVRSGHLTLDPDAPPLSAPAVVDSSALVGGRGFICMLSAPLPPCVGGFPFQLTKSAAVGIGIGGILTIGGTGTIRISVYGAPFTVNTASLVGTTVNGGSLPLYERGFVHGPISFTGTTAVTGGVLQVVTPMRSVSVGGGSGPLSGFVRLTIEFTPEPGRAALLGSGVVWLFFLGRSRRFVSGRDRARRRGET